MAANRSIVRHADGDSEFVVDVRQLPLVITTWFGAPTLGLVEAYDAWLRRFVEAGELAGRKVVLIDDASRAARPVPQVRGRLAELVCPESVVTARIIVVQTPAIRGAVTALSWITGRQLPTVETVEAGIAEAQKIFAQRGIVPPRRLEFEAPQPSART